MKIKKLLSSSSLTLLLI